MELSNCNLYEQGIHQNTASSVIEQAAPDPDLSYEVQCDPVTLACKPRGLPFSKSIHNNRGSLSLPPTLSRVFRPVSVIFSSWLCAQTLEPGLPTGLGICWPPWLSQMVGVPRAGCFPVWLLSPAAWPTSGLIQCSPGVQPGHSEADAWGPAGAANPTKNSPGKWPSQT